MPMWLETPGVDGRTLRFPMDGRRVRVGRLASAEVRILMPEVAPEHCSIEWIAGVPTLRPRPNREVRLNGVVLEDAAPLAAGDVVEVSVVRMSVQEADAPEIETHRRPAIDEHVASGDA